MFLTYMFSFGVELIVNGNIVTYFVETFDMPQTRASSIGAIFGLLNICMRSFGGLWSDVYCQWYGIRGRLHALFQQTFVMGVALIVFSTLTNDNVTTGGLLAVLVWWGSFTNMTEGWCFALDGCQKTSLFLFNMHSRLLYPRWSLVSKMVFT